MVDVGDRVTGGSVTTTLPLTLEIITMHRPQNRVVELVAYLALGVALWISMGMIVRADEGTPQQEAPQQETSDSGAAIADLGSGINIDAGDDVGTVESSNLRGLGALERSRGRRTYFESLSAINLQKAIDAYLENQRERIESYYEMRDYRDQKVADKRHTVSLEDAKRIAKEKAPDRLTSQEFDAKNGKIYWPDPLDDKVLLPYTRLINETFAKRSDPGQRYRGEDARRVQRMVQLMQSAVDTIKHELPVREYITLSDYLSSVSYEASFDAAGNRVDQ